MTSGVMQEMLERTEMLEIEKFEEYLVIVHGWYDQRKARAAEEIQARRLLDDLQDTYGPSWPVRIWKKLVGAILE